MSDPGEPAVWFPTIRTGTGTDVFTERLVAGLRRRDLRAEIRWLPLRSEYAPWTVAVPKLPAWATLVHVNTWLHPRFLPKCLPIVATIHHAVHHQDAHVYKGAARAAYHRFWIASNERRVLRRAARIVAVSRFAAETAKRTLLNVPVEVIYNGIDTERFQPGNRQRRQGEPFRLLYVGGWRKLKGVDLLIPIMRELGGNFELHYTGGSAADCDRAAMPANMHDLGRLNEDGVVAAMQDADALLLPSRSEGFAFVAAEAMACGLPVVATRGSSLTEVIEDGVTGILCQPNDINSFASAVRSLSQDRQFLKVIMSEARRSAERRFSVNNMCSGYLRVYERCLLGI